MVAMAWASPPSWRSPMTKSSSESASIWSNIHEGRTSADAPAGANLGLISMTSHPPSETPRHERAGGTREGGGGVGGVGSGGVGVGGVGGGGVGGGGVGGGGVGGGGVGGGGGGGEGGTSGVALAATLALALADSSSTTW